MPQNPFLNPTQQLMDRYQKCLENKDLKETAAFYKDNLKYYSNETMNVTIESKNKVIIDYKIDPKQKVQTLKLQNCIFKVNFAPEVFCFNVDGKDLDDKKTFEENGVKEGCKIRSRLLREYAGLDDLKETYFQQF